MQLSSILQNVINTTILDINITNITLDSREIKPGTLFCAVNGHNIDARKFIPQTIEKGVAAIIADNDENEDYIDFIDNTPIIHVNNLNSKLSTIAGNFYKHPSEKANIIGITGTNGKTTISQLISQWISLLGKKSATMGTIGNGFYGELTEANNTTGSPFQIQENLANFVKHNAHSVTMEVSSHGLIQHRVDDVNFDIAVFTNLTQDHLDYHKTMDEYFKAKAILFTKFNSKFNILNMDDDACLKIADLIKDKKTIIAVSTKNEHLVKSFKNYIYLTNIKVKNNKLNLQIESSYGDFTLTSSLIGSFNVSNLLQSLACMFSLGFNKDDIIKTGAELKPIIGRMEVFDNKKQAAVVVDYAHTPDALEKALIACKEHADENTKVWCIFGCGGDRDISKRAIMGQVADKLADHIIITNDNPRTEDELAIIEDIKQGITKDFEVITDRKKACEFAIKNAKQDDIILLAGKGHEDYQVIGLKKVAYNEREVVKSLLNIK